MYRLIAAPFVYSALIMLYLATVGAMTLYAQNRTVWLMTRHLEDEVTPLKVPMGGLLEDLPLPVVYFLYGLLFVFPLIFIAAVLLIVVGILLFGAVSSSGWGNVLTILPMVAVPVIFYWGLLYANRNLFGRCHTPRAASLLPAGSMARMRVRLRMFWYSIFAMLPEAAVFAGLAVAMVRNVDYHGSPEVIIDRITMIAIGWLLSSIVLLRVIRICGFLHFRDAHILGRIQNVFHLSWLQFEGYMKLDDPLGFARAELINIQLSLIGRSRQYERSVRGAEHPLATMYANIAHELYDFLASERSLVRELPEDIMRRLQEIAVLVAGGPAIQLFKECEFTSSYEVVSFWARVRRAVMTSIESADPVEKAVATLAKLAVVVVVIYLIGRGQANLPDLIKTLLK